MSNTKSYAVDAQELTDEALISIDVADVYLRIDDIVHRLGISKSSIYAWVKEGEFPPQKKLGKRIARWKESDVNQWLAERPQGAYGQIV